MYRIVESAEDVIKVCEFFGCHAQLDSSPTCPLSHLKKSFKTGKLIPGKNVRSVFHVSYIWITFDISGPASQVSLPQ